MILDLCGGTGAWSEPYRKAGYEVRVVTLPEQDVRDYVPPKNVHGVLAAPPCTEFAASGARWWRDKDPALLAEALEIVAACMRIISKARPSWWALENPVGRLHRFIGPWSYSFHPWEYGDPWYKRTCIWGTAWKPQPMALASPPRSEVMDARHNGPRRYVRPDWIHRLGPSPDRAALRSVTPPGFARAFFEANP